MDYPQQKQSKILVIGETCIDRYVIGSCDRISPEAPVPILFEQNKFEKLGMASNVSTNIKALGQETVLVTNSDKIVKTRFIDSKSKQHILRVDEHDQCESIDVDVLAKILAKQEFTATIISDYNKGFLPEEKIKSFIDLLPKPVFVDTKKQDLSIFEKCIIKINELENSRVSNMPDDSDIIVTYGARGAKFNGEIIATDPVNVVDVCGAGDTFLASLAVYFCEFKNLRSAIKFANKCARVAVQKTGVCSVTLEDIK